MCYKIINGLVSIDSSDFFSFTNCNRTRGHNLKLHIQNCRLDVRKFSFARRVCPVWNTLPTEVVNACSISSFKHKLDAVNLDLYSRIETFSFVRHNAVIFMMHFTVIVGHVLVFYLGTCVSSWMFFLVQIVRSLYIGISGS